MDEDKIEKTIEIILQNQAQFYADLQELKETQREAEKRVNVLERVCLNLYNTSVAQGEQIAEIGRQIAENGRQIAENGEQIAELRESQKETDERLNAVILLAEKYFSRNNGNSEEK